MLPRQVCELKGLVVVASRACYRQLVVGAAFAESCATLSVSEGARVPGTNLAHCAGFQDGKGCYRVFLRPFRIRTIAIIVFQFRVVAGTP